MEHQAECVIVVVVTAGADLAERSGAAAVRAQLHGRLSVSGTVVPVRGAVGGAAVQFVFEQLFESGERTPPHVDVLLVQHAAPAVVPGARPAGIHQRHSGRPTVRERIRPLAVIVAFGLHSVREIL